MQILKELDVNTEKNISYNYDFKLDKSLFKEIVFSTSLLLNR